MNRTVLAALLFSLPAASIAATLTASCNGVAATPVGNTITCTASSGSNSDQASATVSFSSTFAASASALQEFASPPLSGASAEVSGFVNVLVTGGTGAGFLEACMTAFSDAGATGIATFGGVSYAGQSPAPCGGPFSLTEEYSISIIFGAPQVDEFSAQASATLDSAGGASFAGFQVFDSTGTLLSDATVAVTEAVPEPSALVPCLATIGLFYLAAKSGK